MSKKKKIPIEVSVRHCHLSERDAEILFGAGYAFSPLRELSQPGQFAMEETLTLTGPRGKIESVRVIGPLRKMTQVEVSASDARVLGVTAPLRISGSLKDSAAITLTGPKGSSTISE